MGFKGFLATLYSSSFQTFITRRIAGGLYIALVWISTIGAGLGIIASLFQATQSPIMLLAVIALPVGLLVWVVTLRLLFESSIALIVIAENTAK